MKVTRTSVKMFVHINTKLENGRNEIRQSDHLKSNFESHTHSHKKKCFTLLYCIGCMEVKLLFDKSNELNMILIKN